jgi:hypothetical protein
MSVVKDNEKEAGMSSSHDLRRPLCGSVAVAAIATLALAAVATASNATKGASYVGSYSDGATDAIAFKVSTNGEKVIDLVVSTPVKCQGGCGGIGSAGSASATISKSGTFNVNLKLVFPPGSNKSEGTETVAGKFLKHGMATGTVSSHFKGGSSDRTVHWTATN